MTDFMLANPAAAFGNAFQSGMTQGAQSAQMSQQNALRSLYQTQGPGIANGDPNALNALARQDPMAALDARGKQQGLVVGQAQLAEIKARAAAATEEHAAKMTADEAKKESDAMSHVMEGAMMAPDEASYNSWLQQNGVDPATHPFATRDLSAAAILGAKEVLDARAKQADMAPKPQTYRPATAAEAAQYGAVGGQINDATGEFNAINPPSSGITVTNPDGTTMTVGGSSKGANLSQSQASNSGYLLRMQHDQEVLNQNEQQGTELMASIMSNDPTGLANYAQKPEYQVYDQAKRDFVNAALRQESGAVISPSEFANAEKQYFPVPGDSPEAVAQKRKARENKIAGMAISSGKGVDNPLVEGSAGVAAGNTDFSKMAGPQLSRIDISKLSPGQITALEARLKELGF